MSVPDKAWPTDATAPAMPNCQHCGKPVAEVGFLQWTVQIAMGIALLSVMHCPHVDCRKIFGSQILLGPAPQEPSKIARPS